MFLKRLVLVNYRNYEYQIFQPNPKWNILVGNNAQGKTNLLESIYLSARGTSFKSVRDREIIRFGERSAYVRAEIDRNGKEKIVEAKLSMVDRKRVRINEIEVENLRELTNLFDVVLFSPEDLRMVQDGPSYRRRYLDDILSAMDVSYSAQWSEYQKILLQRNHLLKRPVQAYYEQQLKAYEVQLIASAKKIIEKRGRIARALQKRIDEIHPHISHGEERLELTYVTNTPLVEHFEERMAALFQESCHRDREAGHTEFGPHKDDLVLKINGLPVRKYASQGQCRTAVLSLRLAEVALLEQQNGSAPIILLDDVFSELDSFRAKFLLESIRSYQTIVTANDVNGIQLPCNSTVFRIENGQIQENKKQ